MRPVDQLLLAVISAQAVAIVGMVGWMARRVAGQVDSTSRQLGQLRAEIGRHLAWHEGQERAAWATPGRKPAEFYRVSE